MSKSAMQELIDWLKFYDNEPIKPIILKAQIQSLLEKEKENIVTSWNDSKVSMMSGEQYFNETFDNMQNKIQSKTQQKIYTEEQVKDMLELTNLNVQFHIDTMIPIELPSDEDIEKQSEYISHNYFDMHNTNHYQGLKEGSHRMALWMKEQILNQNK